MPSSPTAREQHPMTHCHAIHCSGISTQTHFPQKFTAEQKGVKFLPPWLQRRLLSSETARTKWECRNQIASTPRSAPSRWPQLAYKTLQVDSTPIKTQAFANTSLLLLTAVLIAAHRACRFRGMKHTNKLKERG